MSRRRRLRPEIRIMLASTAPVIHPPPREPGPPARAAPRSERHLPPAARALPPIREGPPQDALPVPDKRRRQAVLLDEPVQRAPHQQVSEFLRPLIVVCRQDAARLYLRQARIQIAPRGFIGVITVHIGSIKIAIRKRGNSIERPLPMHRNPGKPFPALQDIRVDVVHVFLAQCQGAAIPAVRNIGIATYRAVSQGLSGATLRENLGLPRPERDTQRR